MGNKDEAKKLFDLLTETFGSKEVAAGILGNIDVETGGSFSADQKQYKGGPGRGLFQMEGQMLNAYNNYISKNSKENNVNTQVEFLKDILSSGENYDIGAGHRKKIQEAFSSGNVDLISEEFSNRVLRPGKPNLEKRKQSANTFFDELSKAFAGSNAYAAEIPGENNMPRTAPDPRESLTLLQRLLTSPQAEAVFSGMDSVGDFFKNPAESSGKIARGGAEAVTKTIQENPEQVMDLFKNLLSVASPQLSAMASGAGQAGKFAKGFMGNSGQAQASEQKSPYQEGVNKALKSLGEQQAIEAVQSGVPVKQVEQQTQQMVGNDLSSALAGQPQGQPQMQQQVQPQAQQQMQEQQGPGLLKRLLTGFAEGFQSGAAPNLETQRLQKQERLGQQPLQQGKREELSMEFLNNVMKSSGQKTLSADAVKNLENAKTAVDQSTMLLNEFQNDPDLFKSWGGPGDARGQQVGFVIKNLSDTVGRLRSGGAINEEELKTFRSFLPKQGLIKGNLEDKQTVMFKLQTINKLFDGIVKGIQPASEAADLANKIQEAIKSGYKPEEITKYLGF